MSPSLQVRVRFAARGILTVLLFLGVLANAILGGAALFLGFLGAAGRLAVT